MIEDLVKKAKKSSVAMMGLSGEKKNKALMEVISSLEENKDLIFKANKEDLERSEKEGLSQPLLKRLKFDEDKIRDVSRGITDLSCMSDPVGAVQLFRSLDDGLVLKRVSCPIGVVGVIFESRPDALVQISALALKSGNSVILKGGREASLTNKALYECFIEAGEKSGLPEGWIMLLDSRQEVNELLKLDKYVDLLIPRGSNEFVRYIMDNSKIPVMGHADGICHIYADKDADIKMAVSVVTDAKTQYVAVCNAMETLLVHRDIAKSLLPLLKEEMDKKGVKIKGCPETLAVIEAETIEPEGFRNEYLDLCMSVKVVGSLDEAIDHINTYGSGHTDSIVSNDAEAVEKFMTYVDSANVYNNCSTRFSDGFRYGFGAEVGVSTGKLHARGPVGLEGLLSYKYRLYGDGHIVEDYASGKKTFKHKDVK